MVRTRNKKKYDKKKEETTVTYFDPELLEQKQNFKDDPQGHLSNLEPFALFLFSDSKWESQVRRTFSCAKSSTTMNGYFYLLVPLNWLLPTKMNEANLVAFLCHSELWIISLAFIFFETNMIYSAKNESGKCGGVSAREMKKLKAEESLILIKVRWYHAEPRKSIDRSLHCIDSTAAFPKVTPPPPLGHHPGCVTLNMKH